MSVTYWAVAVLGAPRLRGWSPVRRPQPHRDGVLPARAGLVFRRRVLSRRRRSGCQRPGAPPPALPGAGGGLPVFRMSYAACTARSAVSASSGSRRRTRRSGPVTARLAWLSARAALQSPPASRISSRTVIARRWSASAADKPATESRPAVPLSGRTPADSQRTVGRIPGGPLRSGGGSGRRSAGVRLEAVRRPDRAGPEPDSYRTDTGPAGGWPVADACRGWPEAGRGALVSCACETAGWWKSPGAVVPSPAHRPPRARAASHAHRTHRGPGRSSWPWCSSATHSSPRGRDSGRTRGSTRRRGTGSGRSMGRSAHRLPSRALSSRPASRCSTAAVAAAGQERDLQVFSPSRRDVYETDEQYHPFARPVTNR